MTRTQAIGGDPDFVELEVFVSSLLAEMGYVHKPETGSVSWKEPIDRGRVIFKLFNFAENDEMWIAFGVRSEFLGKMDIFDGDILNGDTVSLYAMHGNPSKEEFLGFDVDNKPSSKKRIERCLNIIRHKLQGTDVDLESTNSIASGLDLNGYSLPDGINRKQVNRKCRDKTG